MQSANMLLTAKQIEQYERDGFLVIPDFVNSALCDLLVQRANNLIEQFEPSSIKVYFSAQDQSHADNPYFLDSGNKIHFFFEADALDENGDLKTEKKLSINKIGHALHDLDPVFNSFSRMHKIAALVQDLKVRDPLLVQSMYIFKQPFIGGELNCHQDSTYLYVEKKPVVGLWFALQDATLQNGCLWAIPGGQHIPLKARAIRTKQNKMEMAVYDTSPWPLEKMIPLEVPKGSLVVLHGLLPHMSKENASAQSRHAYILHVMSSEGVYAANNWLRRASAMPFQGFI